MFLSVIVPFFKCKQSINEMYTRLVSVCKCLAFEQFELIFIEDCGEDGSWELIETIATNDSRVKAIQFSRNFGQHYAISAGLDLCGGDWVVVMDCDLQDRPEEIPNLFKKALEGFDIVFARRKNRKDSSLKVQVSRVFNFLFNLLSGIKKDPQVSTYSILSRKVVNSFKLMRESGRAYGGHLRWLGFRIGYLDIEHNERKYGKSSYTLRKAIHLATETIIAFSNKPLRFSVHFGFLIAFFALCSAAWILVKKVIWGISIDGWASIMISIWVLGGMVIFNLGIIGLYLGKVYDETKHRPLYIISQRINI